MKAKQFLNYMCEDGGLRQILQIFIRLLIFTLPRKLSLGAGNIWLGYSACNWLVRRTRFLSKSCIKLSMRFVGSAPGDYLMHKTKTIIGLPQTGIF